MRSFLNQRHKNMKKLHISDLVEMMIVIHLIKLRYIFTLKAYDVWIAIFFVVCTTIALNIP